MAEKYLCRTCSKEVTATKNRRYRTHTDGNGDPCENSSVEIPADLSPVAGGSPEVPKEGEDYATCPTCRRKVKLTRLGYFPSHRTTLRGDTVCDTTGVRMKNLTDLPLPGEELPEKGVNQALRPKVTNQREVEQAKPKGVPLALPPGTTSTSTTPPPNPSTESESTDDPPWGWDRDAWTGEPPSQVEYDAHEEGDSGEPILPLTMQDIARGFQIPEKLMSSPESSTTSTLSSESSTGNETTGSTDSSPPGSGVKSPGLIRQPSSPFLQPVRWTEPLPVILQPPEYRGPVKPEAMGDLAKELATRIKETFYAYDNRKTQDNRSAQTTLGPSEIGTPCDRRLAMALMGVPAVNPGGDGWAAFVGTMGHVGMGEMYTFADAGTGRYAVELPLLYPSKFVPRGTTDLLDRMIATILDWKFMGDYSLKQFKLKGPSTSYRVQAQTYGLGALLAGEKVKDVGIVGLPRAGSSLDEMHVWTEPFDRKVGEAALKRVDDIAGQAFLAGSGPFDQMEVARQFGTADDCRYCPFFLKGDKEMRRGCPGS